MDRFLIVTKNIRLCREIQAKSESMRQCIEQGNTLMKVETIDSQMILVLQSKTERQRLEIAWRMWTSARNMLRRLIQSEHPNWTTEKVDHEVARRLASGG
jgi:ABC-type lipopolysaccharide export system ATPase subunit